MIELDKRPPVISSSLVKNFDELLRGRKELEARARFPQEQLASLDMPLSAFEQKVIGPELARKLSYSLQELLINNSMMSSSVDEARFNTTEYRARIAVLTEQEWTMLHRIKNTLVAEFS